jgi:hypothetical protein
MATVAEDVSTERAAVWEDFIDIFYAPSAVFRRRERGGVFVPMLVVTVLFSVMFFLTSGVLQPVMDAEFERGMAAAMRQNPQLTPEMLERFRAVAQRVQLIGTIVFVPLATVMVGCALWAAGKLVAAKESLHTALIVAAYAYVPKVLDTVARGVQGLFLDPAGLNGQFRVSLGPGRFLDPDTTSPLLLAVVGRLDVFTIWATVLLAIGLAVTGRIPLKRAAIAAALVWCAGAIPLVVGALRTM